MKYKIGDKVRARIVGKCVTGVIENIEYDDYKESMVADLNNGHWVYLEQIIGKV